MASRPEQILATLTAWDPNPPDEALFWGRRRHRKV